MDKKELTEEDLKTLLHEFTVDLQILCKENNFEKIQQLTKDPGNKDGFKDNSWDLMPLLVRRLNEGITSVKKEAIEEILLYIAEITDPEESIFEFLEQFEQGKNDVVFTTLLKPLQSVLLRMPKEKSRNLEWTLNAIQIHFTSLPLPENFALDDDEAPLMDSDPKAIRILVLYESIFEFLTPFLKYRDEVESLNHKIILSCFMMELLAQPLGFLDMTESTTTPPARAFANRILNVIHAYNPNLLMFLQYAEDREKFDFEKENEVFCEDYYACEDKVPLFGISVFYYLIFGEGVKINHLPSVYDTQYVARICLILSAHLLNHSGEYAFKKGLILAEQSLKQIKKESLNLDFLEYHFNKDFIEHLINVMIYSQTSQTRKQSLDVFKSYIDKFSLTARYWLLMNFRSSISHAGLCGFIITHIKDLINNQWTCENTMFKGKLLFDLIIKWCELPKKEKSDLVDNFEQIVASINIVRYLALRDKNSNVSGLWDSIPLLINAFLEPIRLGIYHSRTHYGMKLEEFQKQPRDGGWKDIKLNIKVGNEMIPNIPQNDKVNVILSALNALDLIESLIVRVEECIAAHSKK